ncbi:hypothetical protein BOTBODRAFT_600484 [Botryobasidium botryosum FD-172 SS1]|uniref:G domain-containing protein n=1 Tax=Botryobasidium botryosum (strain FD-172 SS1) TaxID=930990 RepID=A0A067MZ85_BOTB1|nr:hypothetical protein BOTBODRAFT_600484 [Botryobasidium botryosum FD-172 SS1]
MVGSRHSPFSPRILLLGKTGVGKTSLIKCTFNVDYLEPDHFMPGDSNIEDEIRIRLADGRLGYILHDSRGFEPGEFGNIRSVEGFINGRKGQARVEDKLHAIWYCIQIPHAGGRVFERGDEVLLKAGFGDIPIIVVFTQYDRLYDQTEYEMEEARLHGMTEPEIEVFVEEEAQKIFDELCYKPLQRVTSDLGGAKAQLEYARVSHLERYKSNCEELVGKTDDVVRRHVWAS